MHLMTSAEPPTYRQEMIDRWTAWLDIVMATFQEATGIGLYEAFPEVDSILWSMRIWHEPEAVAATWANLYRAKRRWTVPWMAGRLSDKEESGG